MGRGMSEGGENSSLVPQELVAECTDNALYGRRYSISCRGGQIKPIHPEPSL